MCRKSLEGFLAGLKTLVAFNGPHGSRTQTPGWATSEVVSGVKISHDRGHEYNSFTKERSKGDVVGPSRSDWGGVDLIILYWAYLSKG